MFLEAFNQGLIMYEMGGFDFQKAREVFNIPEDYEVGVMIAIGYQDTYHVPPDRLKEKAFTQEQKNHYPKLHLLKNLTTE
jgi:hypothetical protein